jgi:site-specific recombinase XerD
MAEIRSLAERLGPDEIILRNPSGRRWGARNVDTRFRRACKRAGLPKGIVPYHNRYTFGSGLVNSGFRTVHVAKAMGHVTDHKLQEVYFHEEEKKVSDMIESWSAGKPPEKADDSPTVEVLIREIAELRKQIDQMTRKSSDS